MQSNKSTIIGCFLVGLAISCAGCTKPNVYQAPPPPSVTVAPPMVQDVTVYLEEIGQTESVHRAEVRSRLQGFLEEQKFQPGANVKEGELLYIIEQQQYQAALDSANGEYLGARAALLGAKAEIKVANAALTAAEADLNVKELDLKRLDALLPKGAVTQSEWDNGKALRDSAVAARDASIANQSTAAASLENAKAEVKQAEASVNQAKIDLDYTEVKAPISGRITKTDVTRGNLVRNGTLLATVVAENPIWANFNISERNLLRLQKTSERPEDFDITKIKAFLQRAGDEGFPYEGNLDYADPEVDQGTGTLAVRAIFNVPADMPPLIPGLFVRVRVPTRELSDAKLIPEQAVARDQAGAYVLTVGADKKVQRKDVQLGNKEGDMIVVLNGLEPTDMVVVAGIQRARPGVEVAPTETSLEASPSTESQADSSATK